MLNGVVHAEEVCFVPRKIHLLVLGEEMMKGGGGTFHSAPDDEVRQAIGLLSGDIGHSEENRSLQRKDRLV
jgi:hypothetical protein